MQSKMLSHAAQEPSKGQGSPCWQSDTKVSYNVPACFQSVF